MGLEILWRVPVAGDGRTIDPRLWQRGDYGPERKEPHPFARTSGARDGYNYHDLILRIARAAELNGFDGIWIPESESGEDPLIVAGSLAREVPRLDLVPTLRAPLLSAVYAAKIAVSFQRLTGGRLAWNLATAADSSAHPWHGRRWSESEQIARTSEFLDVAKGFWNDPPFTYEGRYYEVVDGGFSPALQGESFPRVYLSGTSDEALTLSAKHADVHFFPLGPVAEIEERARRLQELAARQERTVRIGVEAELLASPTSEEAWSEAERQWQLSEQRVTSLSADVRSPRADFFERTRQGKYLWSGLGTLRPGSHLGLVGGYAELVDAVNEYVDAGVTTIVLGAHPHLEEAYRLGEHLLPFVRRSREPQRKAV